MRKEVETAMTISSVTSRTLQHSMWLTSRVRLLVNITHIYMDIIDICIRVALSIQVSINVREAEDEEVTRLPVRSRPTAVVPVHN